MASRRAGSLFRVGFQELFDFALVDVCVDEAQDFEDQEGGCDVGDEEADAGPEGGVDDEGEDADVGEHSCGFACGIC